MKYLSPLIMAYDDRLKDKNEVIRVYEVCPLSHYFSINNQRVLTFVSHVFVIDGEVRVCCTFNDSVIMCSRNQTSFKNHCLQLDIFMFFYGRFSLTIQFTIAFVPSSVSWKDKDFPFCIKLRYILDFERSRSQRQDSEFFLGRWIL